MKWFSTKADKPEHRFWKWFERHANRLGTDAIGSNLARRDAAVHELNQALQLVAKGLSALIGHGGPSRPGYEIVISADGNQALIPAVQSVVSAAPSIEGWKVVAFKPRANEPLDSSCVVTYQGQQLSGSDVTFRPLELPDRGLRLVLHVNGLTRENFNARGGAAILMLDHALGEFDVMTVVQSLSVEPPPPATDETLYPFAGIAKFIDWWKQRTPPNQN